MVLAASVSRGRVLSVLNRCLSKPGAILSFKGGQEISKLMQRFGGMANQIQILQSSILFPQFLRKIFSLVTRSQFSGLALDDFFQISLQFFILVRPSLDWT